MTALTQQEKRLFTAEEERQERRAIGLGPVGVPCAYCDSDLDESDVHLVVGESYCADCALDEATRLRSDSAAWKALRPDQQIEVLEALQTAGAEAESAIRAELRRKGGAQ